MAITTATADDLLSIVATADLLGVSTKSVRRYISDGRLEAVRIGPRLIRVPRVSIERLGTPVVWSGGAS